MMRKTTRQRIGDKGKHKICNVSMLEMFFSLPTSSKAPPDLPK